jgi:hypothetical protein
MATVSATSVTVTSTRGAREDLSNTLRRVEPQETPMFSLFPQSSAPKAMFTEWLVDSLTEVAFGGKVLDGEDLVLSSTPSGVAGYEDKFQQRERLGNRIEEFRRAFSVSPQAALIDVAGPGASLYAQAKSRAAVELKRDIEAAIGSDQDQAAGTTSAGSKMSGLGQWFNDGKTGAPFDTAGRQAYRVSSGASVDVSSGMTEANLRTVLQTVFENSGAKPSYRLFAGPTTMNSITDFSRTEVATNTPAYQFNQEVGGGTLSLSITTYVSDYGTVSVIPDLFLGRSDGSAATTASKRRAYVIPSDDTANIKFLSPIKVSDHPDTGGGGQRGAVGCMATLCVLNPKACGIFF